MRGLHTVSNVANAWHILGVCLELVPSSPLSSGIYAQQTKILGMNDLGNFV